MGVGKKAEVTQLALFRHGGARRGAGRKRAGERALVPHRPRPRLTRHQPVLVTTRLHDGLPSLRCSRIARILRDAFVAGADRDDFRVVEYSVQSNHLHFLTEASSGAALGRGMQALLVRTARALNREWRRRGPTFVGRYHVRVLRTPRDVRNALVYVLQNARKHGNSVTGVDEISSGPSFEHWRDHAPRSPRVLPRAKSWLLSVGWLRHGKIAVDESPVSRSPLGRA